MPHISSYVQFALSHLSRFNHTSLLGFVQLMQNKSKIGKHLPKNAVILEAGAHKGEDTAEMAKRWPQATIHAFEPVPELFAILTKYTKQYPNVHRYQLALSDKNGSSVLHLSEGTSDASSSLLAPKDHLKIHPTVAFKKQIKVKTMTLDTWAKTYKVSHVDFMWLDMQGMEYKVLKHSKRIFPHSQLLYTEINIKENYTKTTLYPEYKKWLKKSGMTLLSENIYWNDSGNALFVRK